MVTQAQNDEGIGTMSKFYRTREDYARAVFRSLDEATQDAILTMDYDLPPMVHLTNDQFTAFLVDFAENMSVRHNGTVTFTAVEGGYDVDDEAGTL